MDSTKSFGQWLQQRRKALDLTQCALAQLAGCTDEAIRKIETGKRRPSRRLAERLADALRITDADRTAFLQYARVSSILSAPVAVPTSASHSPSTALRIGHLPIPLTSFIGRTAELAALRTLLLRADVRLLTLTGPPSIGKTRLATQATADVGDSFDAIAFVPLASIRDPDLIIPTIAQALTIRETGRRLLIDTLAHALRDRRLLLVLDNLEQVIDGTFRIAQLLDCTSRLTVVVTSRVALRLEAECEFIVPPLALPEREHILDVEEIAGCSAVALFIQRAQAGKTDFALTDANAPAVATLCARLDGLPLAIELAAARCKILTPQALLRRFNQRLDLLSGGVDTDTRQRTLRGAIAWSYELLSLDEQILLRRLGVFVGGSRLEAIETVCGTGTQRDVGGQAIERQTLSTLDLLTVLLDHNLIRQTIDADNEPRFSMLETIRAFALEQLETSGEMEWMRRRHAEEMLRLAERAEPQLRGAGQKQWLDWLEVEHGNLRAALEWSQTPEGDAELGLRLAIALYHFWRVCGFLREGRAWFTEVLQQSGQVNQGYHSLALARAASLAHHQADHVQAWSLAEASLAMAHPSENVVSIAIASGVLGWVAYTQNDYVLACRRSEESLELFQMLGDRYEVAEALHQLGHFALMKGDYAQAAIRFE
jgi:predicted ATPase/DNA-binding XRE family transcriptional regulator